MTTPAERANIALRNEAADIIALIGEKPPHFWRCLAEAAKDKYLPITQAEVGPQRATPASPRQVEAQAKQARKPGNVTVQLGDPRYDKAMDLIEQIEELVEQMPSRGQEFAESVAERTSGIAETIEASGFATVAQIEALENMAGGLSRWVHR